ncbi:hypothetical protein ADIWIN_1774 [Winogradskyella psychrotolerans RS-3]|uniref:Uncharacterized protein n=2 Tax=Winogradskyella TaxID=286104 RepID=S7XBG5_9FLAO|nr:hypothetical protein ADIWIN_1774 [Winogradskyella psychrotolerans RS-3]
MGCSSSDDSDDLSSGCNNWSELYLAQANAYSAAFNAYATDPSVANCQSYKTAGLNYIDALEDVMDCVPNANRQRFLEDVEEYRDEVNAVVCN